MIFRQSPETVEAFGRIVKALIYVGKRKLEWREERDPVIDSSKAAIVRPVASTTCDLDQRLIAGFPAFEPPFALGHEAVGEVVDVGDDVRSVAPGDLVVVPWHHCCGACGNCRAGLTAACESVQPDACYGVPIGGHWGGLFSDLVHVPFADAMLVRLPDGMDPVAAASVSDNLTDSWIAVNKGLTKHPHAPVLVLGGTGCLGPFAVDHAYAAGSSSVHYVDGDANRRAVAAKLGATVHEAMPEDFISRFAVIVSATRDRAELKSAFRALRPGGHLSGLAIFFDDTPIPLWDIYLRDITFSTGRPSVRPHVPAVLDLIAKGALHPRDVVSSIIDWEDAPLALIEPSLKPVVVRAAIFAKS